MGTFQSFRRAYGALKDSTMVGIAKVNSEYKVLDIAIVKATSHLELPPKERHIRKIFSATSVLRPRADVAYCIHTLSKRLSKTRSWIVALKTLIVIHRTLREGDPTFREELLNYSHREHILQIPKFKDDSSPLAWDCSLWVRAYALFLEERLECYRALRYDIESECSSNKTHNSRARVLTAEQLLHQLPALQQFLFRLSSCQPEGSAYTNHLIQYALAMVLKESFKVYCAINDGIINLVDVFFDMSKRDAVKALQIYRRAGQQAENLADLYNHCRGLEVARNFQFPILRQPPTTFLQTMEEYIKEVPHAGSVNGRLEYNKLQQLGDKDQQESREKKREELDPPLIPIEEDTVPKNVAVVATEPNPKALEESNALALAIIPNGVGNQVNNDQPSTFEGFNGLDSSGWELALITTPSTTSNSNRAIEPKMGGGFDKLLLDSLYEDDMARKNLELQNAGYGFGQAYAMSVPKAVEQQVIDPFNSFAIVPQKSVQMGIPQQQLMMQRHQQEMYYPQQQQQNMNMNMSMMMVPYQYQTQSQSQSQQQMQPMVYDPFGGYQLSFQQNNMAQQQQQQQHHGNHLSGYGMNVAQQHWNHGGGGNVNVSGFSAPGVSVTHQHWNHGGGGGGGGGATLSGFSTGKPQQHWNHAGLL